MTDIELTAYGSDSESGKNIHTRLRQIRNRVSDQLYSKSNNSMRTFKRRRASQKITATQYVSKRKHGGKLGKANAYDSESSEEDDYQQVE